MKTLLISPFCDDPCYPLYLPSENLGLGYLASHLRQKGIYVDIFDANMLEVSASEIPSRMPIHQYQFVGIATSAHILIWEAKRIAAEIKKENETAHITIGGHYPTFCHRQILENDPNIDSIIRGDGEQTIVELVERLFAGLPLDNLLGVTFRNSSGKVVVNSPRPFMHDLDALLWPARDTLAYLKGLGHSWPTQISSSRGCYANCAFCDIRAFYGRNWRARNEKNVVDEIEHLHREFGSKIFRFSDDEFLGPKPHGPKRARAIAREIIRRGLEVELMIDARAHAVDEDLFQLLKEAGVVDCLIGIESGVDRILRLYKKGACVSQNVHAIETLRKIGISLNLAFIMFDPRMTFAELRQNFQFLKEHEIMTVDSLKSWLWPLFGTSVVDQLQSQGVITKVNLDGIEYKFIDSGVERMFRIVSRCKEITYPLERLLFFARKHGTLSPPEMDAVSAHNLALWIELFEEALADSTWDDFEGVRKVTEAIRQDVEYRIKRIMT